MTVPVHSYGPRIAVTLLVGMAGLVAWRNGGGADPRDPPPRAVDGSRIAQPPRRLGGDAFEARVRLLETLPDAHIDSPGLDAALPYFREYWRKVQHPWTRMTGTAGQLATMISLHPAGSEGQWTVPTRDGTWTPDAHIWNMNEGTYDEREAIFAPAPSTLSYRMTLPARARLRASPAVAIPSGVVALFEAIVVDPAGVEHTVSETRVAPSEARRWHEVDADLGPWGGQTIELRLRTRTDRPQPGEERRALPKADAGDDEPSAPPSVALTLWGDPSVVASEPTRVPYNVVWIVVDALRPDVAASMHDPEEDAAKRAAPSPPLDALLPAMPGVMPGLDRLAEHGVRFIHAWSAAAWTRPGTLAMLAGERSSELGVDTTTWILPPGAIGHFYASDPPLISRLLRKDGVLTAAFVNNFFMAAYAAVGLDMGFERVTDYRYRTKDTAEIARDTSAWLEAHAHDRFFAFVNFNSPHQPYDPPVEMRSRVPDPPAGPRDPTVRAYVAEAAKDDAAIVALLDAIEALKLTASTLIVLTSDHGETLSAAHNGRGAERMRMRFHHAVGNYEETARVPIVLALPGVLDSGRAVGDRVRTLDIAPTVMDVEGLEADPRMTGRSMLPLARGEAEAQARLVLTEGRGSRAVLWEHWHYIAHDGLERDDAEDRDDAGAPPPEELFDLRTDPGERHNVAPSNPDVVANLRARLVAVRTEALPADAPEQPRATGTLPTVHLLFAGGGSAHRVTATLTCGDGTHAVVATFEPKGVPREAFRVNAVGATTTIDLAFSTAAGETVGLDVRLDPPGAPLRWQLFLDDAPWPPHATFAGAFGLPALAAREGIASDEARAEAFAKRPPVIDATRDLGLFVTRDRPGENPSNLATPSGEAAREMQRMLRDWGYAHGSH